MKTTICFSPICARISNFKFADFEAILIMKRTVLFFWKWNDIKTVLEAHNNTIRASSCVMWIILECPSTNYPDQIRAEFGKPLFGMQLTSHAVHQLKYRNRLPLFFRILSTDRSFYSKYSLNMYRIVKIITKNTASDWSEAPRNFDWMISLLTCCLMQKLLFVMYSAIT